MKYTHLGAVVLGAFISHAPIADAYESRTPMGASIDDSVQVDETRQAQPIAGWYTDAKRLWNYVKRYGKEGVDEFCADYPKKCRWARKNIEKVKGVFE